MERQHCRYPTNALIKEIQINILMDELNIHGTTHDSVSHIDTTQQFQSQTR